MSSRPDTLHDAVIIGAGLAGLATAVELRRRGVAVRVLEGEQRVAEPWRGRYPGLRLNTHRCLSHLPGRTMSRRAGPFPGRNAVIRYLEDYARDAGPGIEYGTRVEQLDYTGDTWRLRTSAGARHARHVVVATGRDRVPVIPDWAGRDGFTGRLAHSSDFRRADYYRNLRVLVIGAGNSGVDLLNHLVRVPTRELWVSVRHGPTVVPTRLYGMPVQAMSPLMALLPLRWVDALLFLTERLAFGDLRRLGLPRHAEGAATRLARDGVTPAFDDGFVKALKHGDVVPVPAVRCFEGSDVVLSDSRRLRADVVICATGYRPGLEDMLGHLDVLDSRGIPRFQGDEPCPASPGLWFTGMRPGLEGYFRGACVEGRRLARRIRRELR